MPLPQGARMMKTVILRERGYPVITAVNEPHRSGIPDHPVKPD
jgi:hypothetical protein